VFDLERFKRILRVSIRYRHEIIRRIHFRKVFAMIENQDLRPDTVYVGHGAIQADLKNFKAGTFVRQCYGP